MEEILKCFLPFVRLCVMKPVEGETIRNFPLTMSNSPLCSVSEPPSYSFLLLLIPFLMLTPVEFVFFLCLYPIQVCRDIDECEGINNGGCVANSICMNTPVSVNTVFHTLLAVTLFGEFAANSCSTIKHFDTTYHVTAQRHQLLQVQYWCLFKFLSNENTNLQAGMCDLTGKRC